MNNELKAIFNDGITTEYRLVPTAHLKYKGSSKTFVTWTITGESPSLSANDEDLYGVCAVDVDIFSDGNYLDIVSAVKKIMKNNGWVWVEDSSEMYENDTGLYHKTCSFEKDEVLIWQE